MLNVGTKVILEMSNLPGQISGYATARGTGFYVMELDEGFWNEGKTVFITLLIVHESAISIEESEDYWSIERLSRLSGSKLD